MLWFEIIFMASWTWRSIYGIIPLFYSLDYGQVLEGHPYYAKNLNCIHISIVHQSYTWVGLCYDSRPWSWSINSIILIYGITPPIPPITIVCDPSLVHKKSYRCPYPTLRTIISYTEHFCGFELIHGPWSIEASCRD